MHIRIHLCRSMGIICMYVCIYVHTHKHTYIHVYW
jgi:hypothetical protein